MQQMIALHYHKLRIRFEIPSKETRVGELLGGRLRVLVGARQPLPPVPGLGISTFFIQTGRQWLLHFNVSKRSCLISSPSVIANF